RRAPALAAQVGAARQRHMARGPPASESQIFSGVFAEVYDVVVRVCDDARRRVLLQQSLMNFTVWEGLSLIARSFQILPVPSADVWENLRYPVLGQTDAPPLIDSELLIHRCEQLYCRLRGFR